jgi:HEAT repeat protein
MGRVSPDRHDVGSRRREASREHGFQDEIPESSWSPERQRFAEQVGLLVRALRSTEQSVQQLAVVQISLLGPKVVPHLTSALEDALDESDQRQSAHKSASSPERGIAGICSALGIIRDSDVVVDLAAALPRKEAVEALAKIGGERALDLIMDTIENKPSLGGSLASHGGHSSWPSTSADADPAFVRRVFLRFGESGRKRLQEELADGSGSRRETVAEIIRIIGDSDGLA